MFLPQESELNPSAMPCLCPLVSANLWPVLAKRNNMPVPNPNAWLLWTINSSRNTSAYAKNSIQTAYSNSPFSIKPANTQLICFPHGRVIGIRIFKCTRLYTIITSSSWICLGLLDKIFQKNIPEMLVFHGHKLKQDDRIHIQKSHLQVTKITLPETNSSHLKMDGWNTSFLLGWPNFRCELLVSGSVSLPPKPTWSTGHISHMPCRKNPKIPMESRCLSLDPTIPCHPPNHLLSEPWSLSGGHRLPIVTNEVI